VSLAFLKFMIFHFSQQRHVALLTSYNTDITQHKHTTNSNKIKQDKTVENGRFNILEILRFCDKRDMATEWWLARYVFVSFGWQSQNDWKRVDYPRYNY
jgi:hypothetical protein